MTLTFPSTSPGPFSELLRLTFGGERPTAPLVEQAGATTAAVHHVVRRFPGLLITELEAKLPTKSKAAIRAAVKRLKATGAIRVEGLHNQFRYFPAGDK